MKQMLATVSKGTLVTLLMAGAALMNPASAQEAQRDISGEGLVLAGYRCPNESIREPDEEDEWKETWLQLCSFPKGRPNDRYVSEIFQVKGDCPQGSFLADGRSLSTSDYRTLFDFIGYKFVENLTVEGRAHFNLPDLRDEPGIQCVAYVGLAPYPSYGAN
jgi:hypothetical protein